MGAVKNTYLIGKESFSYLALIFIISILIEHVFNKTISRYVNIELFFSIIIVLGLITILEVKQR
jgi:hypothetical protein